MNAEQTVVLLNLSQCKSPTTKMIVILLLSIGLQHVSTVFIWLVFVYDIRYTDLAGSFPIPTVAGPLYLRDILCINYIRF